MKSHKVLGQADRKDKWRNGWNRTASASDIFSFRPPWSPATAKPPFFYPKKKEKQKTGTRGAGQWGASYGYARPSVPPARPGRTWLDAVRIIYPALAVSGPHAALIMDCIDAHGWWIWWGMRWVSVSDDRQIGMSPVTRSSWSSRLNYKITLEYHSHDRTRRGVTTQ